MQKVFEEVNSLDKRCYEEFALSEDLLMEHASSEMARFIEKNFVKGKSVLIVCGPGNNGADGIALARLLYSSYDIKLFIPFGTKSKMAKLQEKRCDLLGIQETKSLEYTDVIVDCLFGSGLNKDLDRNSQDIINTLNSFSSYKLACDIPSGIDSQGQITSVAFQADTSITMGALKTSLFSDSAKDYVGEILLANLGVQREIYESSSKIHLLDKEDMNLPFRNKKNSHKGSFGHLNVIAGCKKGAGIIASNAAFSFGAGLVSIVCHEKLDVPSHIMQSHFISENCTAIAIGMGLGNYEVDEIKKILSKDKAFIIDADLFYERLILEVLDKELVLTPHPKEFCSLLKLCEISDISVEELQNNRFKYIKEFSLKYPSVVILLKGANTLIAQGSNIYINIFGQQSLAKGGSGDVLSGLIGALLAQGYKSLDATITASLAHSMASLNFSKNSYALTPNDIIDEVTKL